MSMGNGIVIEFTRQEDLKQACYEATLDLQLYIAHIMDLVGRSQKYFPEVAAGLHGSASGIGQYLRGIDGDWKTAATEDLHKILSDDRFRDHQWAYEFCRDPRCALILFGWMAAVAAAKPELTFWEVLGQAREKLGDMAPLIENLLASSPRRTQ